MDNLSAADRRRNMQNIRSTGTKMEQRVAKALWHRGLRFRKNVKNLPGKPDLAMKRYKIVVFLDSCFFHRCPEHFVVPGSNTEFWLLKIARNQARDRELNLKYAAKGWRVLRFWEHETKKELDRVVDRIAEAVAERKRELLERSVSHAEGGSGEPAEFSERTEHCGLSEPGESRE